MSGRNITNACFKAGPNVSGASNAARRANFRYRGGGAATSLTGWDVFNTVAIASFLSLGLATKRNRTEVFCQWSKRSYGQKQKGANDYYCTQQQKAEGRRVVAQSSQSKRRRFLCAETRCHGYGGDNRQVPAEYHYQTCCNVPWHECRRGVRITDRPACRADP